MNTTSPARHYETMRWLQILFWVGLLFFKILFLTHFMAEYTRLEWIQFAYYVVAAIAGFYGVAYFFTKWLERYYEEYRQTPHWIGRAALLARWPLLLVILIFAAHLCIGQWLGNDFYKDILPKEKVPVPDGDMQKTPLLRASLYTFFGCIFAYTRWFLWRQAKLKQHIDEQDDPTAYRVGRDGLDDALNNDRAKN
jgi:hypothetical protein